MLPRDPMEAFSVIETTHQRRTARPPRWRVLYGLLLLAVLSLLGRSFYLQVLSGTALRAQAEGNRIATSIQSAPRGIITDRTGTQLVENVASTDVVFDPTLLPGEEHEGTLFERLPQYLDISPDALRGIITTARRERRDVIIAKAVEHDTLLRLEEAQAQLPGIRLTSSLVRKYPYAGATAHVVGYTSPVSETELTASAGLIPTDITGKTGLEKQYDELLHGTHGATYVEINAAGRPQKEVGQQPATPGSHLQLTLDIELQEYIHSLLADRAQERTATDPPTAGAVIALDPRSGEVRALVSYPPFDPNIFSQPSRQSESNSILSAPGEPLFNRTTDGTYPPGSTIKPLLAAAALAEGIITPATTIQSTGGISIGPWQFPDWKSGGHGSTNVEKAIAESVNTFFYLITGGNADQTGLGVTRATAYLKKFGWGLPAGIDLPSESAGLLPSAEWKEATKGEVWYIGDTYHLGIGQGDVMVTPLQVASATAAIAQNGTWHTPHLVAAITHPNRQPETIAANTHTLGIAPAHLATVRAGMRAAVTDGSARQLVGLPLPLAGKTGTAQVGGSEPTHAWFTSFGPYDSPELVVTVLLEKGGAGDTDAVPLAADIWQWWIDHRHAIPTGG